MSTEPNVFTPSLRERRYYRRRRLNDVTTADSENWYECCAHDVLNFRIIRKYDILVLEGSLRGSGERHSFRFVDFFSSPTMLFQVRDDLRCYSDAIVI